MDHATNDYHFVTVWEVEGTLYEVSDILGDPLSLPHWWPDVYLSADEVQPPGPDGLGRRVRVHTKGRLPYTLRWEFEVVSSSYPRGFVIAATGDFVGRGIWMLDAQGPTVHVTFDWRIAAEKPLLKHLSFLFKPIFRANHEWAMARGKESLARELVRRRGGGG